MLTSRQKKKLYYGINWAVALSILVTLSILVAFDDVYFIWTKEFLYNFVLKILAKSNLAKKRAKYTV